MDDPRKEIAGIAVILDALKPFDVKIQRRMLAFVVDWHRGESAKQAQEKQP